MERNSNSQKVSEINHLFPTNPIRKSYGKEQKRKDHCAKQNITKAKQNR